MLKNVSIDYVHCEIQSYIISHCAHVQFQMQRKTIYSLTEKDYNVMKKMNSTTVWTYTQIKAALFDRIGE